MRQWFVVVVVAVVMVVVLLSVATSLSFDEPTQAKLTTLLERSVNTPLITFTESDFSRFINKGPRPYWILTILTVQSTSCIPCQEVKPEIERLAKIIEEQRKTKGENEELFVVQLEFEDNRDLFRKIGLSSVPMIFLVPSTKSHRELYSNKLLTILGPKYQYSLTQGRAAEEIGKWITQTSKIPLSFPSTFKVPDNQYLIPGGIILGVVIIYFNRLRKFMVGYTIICSLVYGFVMGGGMFSYLQEVPFKGHGDDIHSYINGSSGYQYIAEGFILGALNLITGIGGFIIFNSLRKSKERSNRWFKWLSYIPAWMGLAIMAGGSYGILWVYDMKNEGYNMGHVGMEG